MADGENARSGSSEAQQAQDVTDKTQDDTSPTADDVAGGEHEEAEDGEEEEADVEDAAVEEEPTKKKKKPKKKKKKAAATEETAETSLASAARSNPVQVQDINSLLQQLATSKPTKSDAKAQEDYKFWNTQPVPKFKEPNLLQTTNGEEPEGPILPDKICQASAKSEPEKLVDGFEWCLIDLDDKEELQEFYDLLYNHYVEDTDGSFRFNYSTKFLAWALKPPGWKKEWHIGVRTKSQEGKKGKLVASIAGIPVTLWVRGQKINVSEINFLAIHRKLRNKRLAPVLIKEVTRRCYLAGIYQALYTAGTMLPTPVTTCRYFHRSLDWEHLYQTGFSHMPAGSSALRQKYKYKVESNPLTKGLRQMKSADIPAVRDLLARYTERFDLRQEFSNEEIEHWICSDTSKDVVSSYVIEQDGKITDFVSYYVLEVSYTIHRCLIVAALTLFISPPSSAHPRRRRYERRTCTIMQPRLPSRRTRRRRPRMRRTPCRHGCSCSYMMP